jgi:hypothetical protein
MDRGDTSTLKIGRHVPYTHWHPPTSSHDVTVQGPKIRRLAAVKKSQTLYTQEMYVSENASLKYANY